MIWTLATKTTLHPSEIAKRLNISIYQVKRFIYSFRRFPSFSRQRIGKPHKIKNIKSVEGILKTHCGVSNKKLAQIISEETGIKISPTTAWRIRYQANTTRRTQKRHYFLYRSDRRKRLQFCLKYLDDEFSNVFWGDGVWFGESTKKKFIYWNDKWGTPPEEIGFKVKPIFMYGAVSINGCTDLVEIPGNIDSRKYTEMLEKFLPQMNLYYPNGWRWIQDRWSVGTSQWTSKWLHSNVNWIEDFPPKSGDLNLIEYVWSWIKHKLEEKTFIDKDEVYSAVQECWANITPEFIRSELQHLKDVMRAVIKNKGKYINEGYLKKLKRKKEMYE